jgi:hypothetical protein
VLGAWGLLSMVVRRTETLHNYVRICTCPRAYLWSLAERECFSVSVESVERTADERDHSRDVSVRTVSSSRQQLHRS